MQRVFTLSLTWACAICLGGIVVGCGGSTMLMPTPNVYADGRLNPFADVPPELQHNHAEVLYVTDRKPENPTPNNPHYGFERSRSVAFGVSDIEFGEGVSWDQLVTASRTSKRSADLPLKVVSTKEMIRFPSTPHIFLELGPNVPGPDTNGPATRGSTTRLSPRALAMRAELESDTARAMAVLSARLAQTKDKEVYLFIHGYDNTFDDSVMTIAEMWHFLGRRGVPVAYSWPAGHGGLLRGYTYDRESSEFTVYHLKELIRDIAECPDVKKIHIISHSRGTGVAVTALCQLHLEIAGSGRSTRDVLKLGTLILAAPDIDLDVLIQQAVTVRLGTVPEHTVVYVCAKDKALGVSNWLFGGITRAGAMRSSMFDADELELLRERKTVQIIDARISDPGPFGHSYFHANPAVSSDLMLLLRYHLDPGPESGRPLRHDDGPFWIIDDGYPDHPIVPARKSDYGRPTGICG
jgi:esterase/lipase superfamily enzyme